MEIGKGKLAESAAYVLKLQDEQSRAKEQISEYATQVRTAHAVACVGNRPLTWQAWTDTKCLLIELLLTTHANIVCKHDKQLGPNLLCITTWFNAP